jgi:hypothetical protein
MSQYECACGRNFTNDATFPNLFTRTPNSLYGGTVLHVMPLPLSVSTGNNKVIVVNTVQVTSEIFW